MVSVPAVLPLTVLLLSRRAATEEDAAAVPTGRVVADGAVVQGQRAKFVKDAAAVGARRVAADGAVGQGYRAVAATEVTYAAAPATASARCCR